MIPIIRRDFCRSEMLLVTECTLSNYIKIRFLTNPWIEMTMRKLGSGGYEVVSTFSNPLHIHQKTKKNRNLEGDLWTEKPIL